MAAISNKVDKFVLYLYTICYESLKFKCVDFLTKIDFTFLLTLDDNI